MAIGAGGNDANGAGSGHVRLYEWNGSVWSQLGEDIDGESTYDNSGTGLSLSSGGSIVAIGAPSATVTKPGHVRVFSFE